MSDYDIGEAFAKIEDELIASMMRNIDRHRAEETKEGYEWSMWQTEQLQALEKYKKENARKYPGKFKDINDRISALISIAHDEGRMKQEEAILKAIRNGFRGTKKRGKGIDGEFFRLSERKLEALINATMNDMQNAETAILRMANDKYRSTIFNAQVYYNTGAGTFEKAVDMATKDMLAAGLNCVQYKNGARHRLEDYAGMALRTASTRAKLYGEGEMRQEWGVHTVIMNKRANPCPKCLPFVGKVMIDDVWSGGRASDGPYPLMSSAIAAGLYHVNCKDMHTTFFPGISDAPDDTWTPAELEDVQMFNEAKARQQYAERQEEKFGRLAKYSLDPENKKRYEVRRQQWKKAANQKNVLTDEDTKILYEYISSKSYVINEKLRNGAKLSYEEKKMVSGLNETLDKMPKYKCNEWRIAKDSKNDIIISGARILNPDDADGLKFAKMYYEEIRSFSTDTKKIAKNLGKEEADIKKVKSYLFEDKVLYDSDMKEYKRFEPDCAIAQSWQRLIIGKDIKKHDMTLIEHELLEMRIKRENPGIEHHEAHRLASNIYNYPKEAEEYYGNLKKHKKSTK